VACLNTQIKENLEPALKQNDSDLNLSIALDAGTPRATIELAPNFG